jgi:hypothetical protein
LAMIPIERFRPCVPPGVVIVTLIVPLESRWMLSTLVHQGEQMYEHIAYELKHGSFKFDRA